VWDWSAHSVILRHLDYAQAYWRHEEKNDGLRESKISSVGFTFFPPNVSSTAQPLDQGIIASFSTGVLSNAFHEAWREGRYQGYGVAGFRSYLLSFIAVVQREALEFTAADEVMQL
jgi:hypothetical protein